MLGVSDQTLLTVILIAIAANLVLAVGLLVVPRVRRRRQARAEAARMAAARSSVRHGDSEPRGMVPVFGGSGSASVQADPQTGLAVATTWHRWLQEEETRVRRYRRPATLVLVEIEGLERLVERLGPGAADKLIPPIAATMRRHAREADRVARLGPARFGAVLPETDEVQAINYVERIRSTCDMWLAAGAVSLRLSMGWAESNAARSMDAALQAAEERLNAERHRDRGDAPAGPSEGSLNPNPAPAS